MTHCRLRPAYLAGLAGRLKCPFGLLRRAQGEPGSGGGAEPGARPVGGQTGFTVLVAKVLTPSDANSGRIILPRTMVEANLNFVMGYR